jgi:hypothetical protein
MRDLLHALAHLTADDLGSLIGLVALLVGSLFIGAVLS